MYIWLILALLFAALEAIAVVKSLPGLEYVAKPAVMVCLFLWLYFNTGLLGSTFWFGLAVLLSLAGDVLLMLPPERLFFFGLFAFLLAHVSYIIGFRAELEIINAWSLVLLAIIAVNASRILRRIIGAMRASGENKLVVPIVIYGIVISFMLFAAMSTLFDPAWQAGAALLVSAGAALFCASDTMLAWNKFVSPVSNGKVMIIVLYHLGQIGLIAGVVSQVS